MSREPQISISLNGHEGLELDPWKGFCGRIHLAVTSAEETTNGDPPLLIEYHSPGFEAHGVACSWVFAIGLLVMRDQDGTNIPIHYPKDPPQRDSSVQYLRGSRVDEYCLLGMDSASSLRQMRKKLKSGSVYTLALTEQPFIMQACFMEPDKPRLEPCLNDRWINVQCSGTQVPFRVLAAAPVPRFTISVTTSSNIWHARTDSDFKLSMTITSLNRTPVKVSWGALRSLFNWFGEIECSDVDNEWGGYRPIFMGYGQPEQLGNGSSAIGPSANTFDYGFIDTWGVCFPYGGTWTSQYKLAIIRPLPADTCRLSLHLDFTRLALNDWNYVNAIEGVDADDRAKWPSKGYIVPEPVHHGWDTIESMLEAARPFPFFKLPQELRDIIYDLAKWSEDIGDVRFTYVVD